MAFRIRTLGDHGSVIAGRTTTRRTWMLLGLLAATVALAALSACNETTRPLADDPGPLRDQATVVGTELAAELALVGPNGVGVSTHTVYHAELPVIAARFPAFQAPHPVGGNALPAPSFAIGGGTPGAHAVHKTHIKARDGHLYTVATVANDDPTQPPQRIFQFVDGKVQSVTSIRYKHVGPGGEGGGGWVRARSRTTVFDRTGTPQSQVTFDAHNTRTASLTERAEGRGRRIVEVALGALARAALPDALAAQSPTCASEAQDVASAAANVADLTAQLSTAQSACDGGDQGACTVAGNLNASLASAVAAYNNAVDVLNQCGTSGDAGGSDSYYGDSGASDDGSYAGGGGSDLYDTIDQFIANSGDYYCNSDGLYCVFYAA